MLSPTNRLYSQAITSRPQTCKLLLFSDTREGIEHITSEIMNRDLRITGSTTLEELREACLTNYDIVIVDAGPDLIEQLLKEIRKTPTMSNIPLLVVADRIVSEERLAGVLPAYRAMPCGGDQLLWLVRQQRTRDRSKQETPKLSESKIY